MTLQTKGLVVGDVVKFEEPFEMARLSKVITRVPGATLKMPVGEMLEPAGAVANIQTTANVAGAPTADGGTYRLGYEGEWTTALAWNATLATAKTAFELIPKVLALDTVTFSAAPAVTGTTCTWATAGKRSDIDVDSRLLLDGAVVMTMTMTHTTPGSVAATDVVLCATGGNVTGILLEEISLLRLQTDNNIRAPFLVKGTSLVNGDNLYTIAAQLAAAKVAMVALGVTIRTGSTLYQAGPPTS